MSVSNSGENVTTAFADAIQDSIKRAINNAFDEAIKKAVKEAEAKRDEIVAAAALRLSSWVSFQENKTTLEIVIKKPE